MYTRGNAAVGLRAIVDGVDQMEPVESKVLVTETTGQVMNPLFPWLQLVNVLVVMIVVTGRTRITCEGVVKTVVAKPLGVAAAPPPSPPTPMPTPRPTLSDRATLGRVRVGRARMAVVGALLTAELVRVVYVGMAVALLVDVTVAPETTATIRFPTDTIESTVLDPVPAFPKALRKVQRPLELEKTPMQPEKAVQRLLHSTAGATALATALLITGDVMTVAAGKVVLQRTW